MSGVDGGGAGGAVLSLRNVSSGYVTRRYGLFGRRDERRVLRDVSLEIGEGEIFGLVGESGCGKTTLCRCVLGLAACAGVIERRGLAQAVFQDPAGALNPAMRVGRVLEEPLRIHRLGGRLERERRVAEMLGLVGLDASYAGRFPHELSSGQKQRVSIGFALMLRPRLLVADEPVSALDVSVGAQILNLFRDLKGRMGLSILFVSHSLPLVYYLCDRIAVMRGGRIVETGPAEEVYTRPREAYTRELLAALAGRPEGRAKPG